MLNEGHTLAKKNVNKSKAVRDYANAHPKASTKDIADALHLSYGTAHTAMKKNARRDKKTATLADPGQTTLLTKAKGLLEKVREALSK